MTADMNAFKQETRGAIFTTFLSVKGKVMFDAMVAKPKLAEQREDGELEYWMDLAQEDAQDALKHLKKYAIRKKVQIQDISHFIQVFSV